MAAQPQTLLPIGASGLIVELAYAWLKPAAGREREVQAFAFVVPVALYAAFFATLILTSGVWWSTHLSAGVPVLAGGTGLLMSLVASPVAGDAT